MLSYEERNRGSLAPKLLTLVLVGGIVGLFYIGPSSWSWRGILSPVVAGITFFGAFFTVGRINEDGPFSIDIRSNWVRTGLGLIAGGVAGLLFALVAGGTSLVAATAVGVGVGGVAAFFETP